MSVQKRHGMIHPGDLHSKFYVFIQGVDILQEPTFVCCFDDHRGVIHIPFPHIEGVG